jgi:hypothetical protein
LWLGCPYEIPFFQFNVFFSLFGVINRFLMFVGSLLPKLIHYSSLEIQYAQLWCYAIIGAKPQMPNVSCCS